MRRIIEAILCIFVGIFLFGIIAITFQVIGEDSPNKASIIGGILSMIGGAIGAMGAYIVATYQMNKQSEIQEKNRALELKVNKSNTALNKLIELKELIYSIRGNLYDMEIEIKNKIQANKFQYLNEYLLVEDVYRNQLMPNIDKILNKRKDIEQLKIFISKEVDFELFNKEVFEYIEAYKSYINLNWEFEDSIDAFETDVYKIWRKIYADYDSSYEKFIAILNTKIKKIENYIIKIIEI